MTGTLYCMVSPHVVRSTKRILQRWQPVRCHQMASSGPTGPSSRAHPGVWRSRHYASYSNYSSYLNIIVTNHTMYIQKIIVTGNYSM